MNASQRAETFHQRDQRLLESTPAIRVTSIAGTGRFSPIGERDAYSSSIELHRRFLRLPLLSFNSPI